MVFRKGRFWKKIKLGSIGDYLTFYDDYGKFDFLMSIERNNISDIQIFKSSFKTKNFRLTNDNDFILVLTFAKDLSNRDNCINRFKNSKFYKDSVFLKEASSEDAWVYRMEKNTQKLFDNLDYITGEIYEYYDGIPYSIAFYVIDEKNNYTPTQEICIPWLQYLKKRLKIALLRLT